MKYSVGPGLIAFAVSVSACSGTSSIAPPPYEAGVPGAADAGPDGSNVDASNGGEAGAPGALGAAGASSTGGEGGEGGAAPSCKPGALSCDGARVQSCNPSGSGFTTVKTCSLSQTCSEGACLDITCVPNTTFCNAGNVWSCGADGTSSALTAHCTSDQFCLEKDRVAICRVGTQFIVPNRVDDQRQINQLSARPLGWLR